MAHARLAPLLALVLGGCAMVTGSEGLPGVAEGALLDDARVALLDGRHDDAAAIAESLLEGELAREDQAEARFVAGEARLSRGDHTEALQHYLWILENAPWSPRSAALEERLYRLGLAFLRDDRYAGIFGSRGRGIEALETLQIHFSRSERADDALRLVADHFSSDEVGEYEEAALVYERLVEEYPNSEWVERALWRIGYCRMRLAMGAEYDRNMLLAARQALQRSLDLYPRGVASDEARRDLGEVLEMLASKELAVADFYRARGQAEGERLRLANAALLYPTTEAGRQAERRLAELGLDPRALASAGAHSIDNVHAEPSPWADP